MGVGAVVVPPPLAHAVINDAVAIVLFQVFDDISKSGSGAEGGASGWQQFGRAVGKFSYVTVASVAIGLGVGLFAAVITRWWWIRGLAHVEVVLLTGLAYISYVAAETAATSGIMALFV